MPTATQSVNVTGKDQNVTVVGNDFVVTDTYVSMQAKPQFFEPTLEQFQPPKFVSPQITSGLVQNVRQQRLLMLAGTLRVDKSALAGHIAWHLGETISPNFSANGNSIPIQEWSRSSNPQDLVAAMREEKKASIFILPRILPQHVNYDLFPIKKAASSGGHYIVASTDVPLPSWKLGNEAERLFWHELLADGLYSLHDLAEVLVQKLDEAKKSLPAQLFSNHLDPARPLIGNLPLQTVAETLKTPDNIAIFVQFLCTEKTELRQSDVEKLIRRAQQDDYRVLHQWYHTFLDSREQLLALGLSLFNGLFDDQFFAALEQLVEQVWQRRDPSLRALDYCDLDNMHHFFSIDATKSHGIKIESRFSDEQRRHLFQVAWHSHRRQILTALPVMAQLVRKSVARNASSHSELYGNKARRDQLRGVIGEALSDIGLISIRAVEDTLLNLAAHGNLGVQAVAARAMARWREYGGDEELFETLQRWQDETRIIDLIEDILQAGNKEKRQNPRAYIRATVALTVSYAAQYDAPNTLSQNLCDFLVELSEDLNSLVRDRFRRHTLPLVVPLHFAQLRDILRDMTRFIDLDQAIAASLAVTYRIGDANQVLSTLDSWYNECVEERPRYVNTEEITRREALLATVALTYGEIQYDEESGPLTVDDAFKRLQHILAEERHPLVRTAVVIAIGRQAGRHFERVEAQLEKLVVEVKKEERDEIVTILTKVYLEQRRKLEGSEEMIQIDKKYYPVWINSERPLTAVEEAMYRWIKRAINPVAPQIATQASVWFALLLEQDEKDLITEIREQRKRAEEESENEEDEAERDATTETITTKRSQQGFLIDKFVPWWSTLGTTCDASLIRTLLPEALALHRASKKSMDFVLAKWKNSPDREIQTIAKCLKSAIGLAESPAIIYIMFGGLMIFMMYLMMAICS